MAISNREWVGRILDELKPALGNYVVQNYFQHHPNRDYITQIKQDLKAHSQSRDVRLSAIHDEESLLREVDVQGWLRLIRHGSATNPDNNQRVNIFKGRFTPLMRSHMRELLDYRNTWAHQKPISTEDAYYVAVIAARLLDDINAKTQAQAVREIANRLLQMGRTAAFSPVGAPVLYMVNEAEAEGCTEPITLYPGDWIEFRYQGDDIRQHPLPARDQRLIIGRSPATSDVALPDKKVSRVHLQIARNQDEELTLTDLRSANGTWLNGSRIPPNTPVSWLHGQAVIIGSTELVLRLNHDQERRTA
ncbi:MAG: FHA domain-containing protein [Chloroflexi bacterium]|nr:FHA domain-containing protein [Chloroflexota bacterium]